MDMFCATAPAVGGGLRDIAGNDKFSCTRCRNPLQPSRLLKNFECNITNRAATTMKANPDPHRHAGPVYRTGSLTSPMLRRFCQLRPFHSRWSQAHMMIQPL